MLWELMRLYDWRIITYISSFPVIEDRNVEEEMLESLFMSRRSNAAHKDPVSEVKGVLSHGHLYGFLQESNTRDSK